MQAGKGGPGGQRIRLGNRSRSSNNLGVSIGFTWLVILALAMYLAASCLVGRLTRPT